MAPAGTAAGALLRLRSDQDTHARRVSGGTASPQQWTDTWSVNSVGVSVMLTEIAYLLSTPDQYVRCYRDGEIYIELATVAAE